MGAAVKTRDDDLRELEMMHLIEVEGLTQAAAAERLGLKRNAVVGLYWRINTQTDKHDVSPYLNGSMPERWWEVPPAS